MSVTPLPSLDRGRAATAVPAADRRTGLRRADLGAAVERCTEWTTAALLGRHPPTPHRSR